MDFLLSYARSWFSGICNYGLRVGDAVSQLINTAIFFSNNPNESLSGRSYRQKRHWFWGKMYKLLNWAFSPFQQDHCKKSHDADVARASELLKSAV